MSPVVHKYTVEFGENERIDVVVDYRTSAITSLSPSRLVAACLTAPIEEETAEIYVTSSLAGALMLETKDGEGELLGRMTHDGIGWVTHT